ncbi:hypothetical protein FOQG_08277 [Fusarium oxysporum f. sp. raphani 54005]|uniref:Uncharacterized protein n=3 Tax=Fusarium oxysporum TaxID=5507 RepID=X0CC75_FUSOX|nr:hypothetical protein FOVG_02272 [Fusarium oxysporum f. sp. pisi HDV247]EXK88449.1 hypothetical protein FOQG_08277 [Fusarium oxysporum f. sp. raphani 54005]EXM24459.1 hypothetical protein FOTG_08462 [Fusarium oxysporum f. sp. vasinfectum 25433]
MVYLRSSSAIFSDKGASCLLYRLILTLMNSESFFISAMVFAVVLAGVSPLIFSAFLTLRAFTRAALSLVSPTFSFVSSAFSFKRSSLDSFVLLFFFLLAFLAFLLASLAISMSILGSGFLASGTSKSFSTSSSSSRISFSISSFAAGVSQVRKTIEDMYLRIATRHSRVQLLHLSGASSGFSTALLLGYRRIGRVGLLRK